MMLRIFFSISMLFSSFLFCSNRMELPQMVILNEKISPLNSSWGLQAFNGAPEIAVFIAHLKQAYQIDTVIETGTSTGVTTAFLASCFEQVHTIEIVPTTFENSKNFLSPYPNVQCHLGSSESVLRQLLPSLKEKPVLFYLDAHWNSYWPLLDELKEISITHKDNCIIVIDDFKVPFRPDIPYDKYGWNECSFEYIKEMLNNLFTEYTYHYLIPNNVASRAKFVAIPKKWQM